ncbi:MAG: carbohydrate kinase family protein [Anaerolineales bacterium]|nr:carbohydrate kinase family protein [Anaerolineales bacterium]
MSDTPTPSCLILGRLQRDTIINAAGQALIDQPGGNLLYAAAAYQVWGDVPGLVSRIGSDFPMDWESQLGAAQLDTRGVVRLAEPQDQRRFVAYSDVATAHRDNPIKYFARHNLPFPKSLLGYQAIVERLDSKRERNALSLRPDDLPATYRGASAAHLCPLDYHSHKLLPAALRAEGTQLITLDAGRGYMQPDFLYEVPELVNGLTVFLTTEERLVTLFANRSDDTWKMIETLGSFNCKAVVVHSIHRGQWVLDVEARKRYQIPPYPGRVADITNAGSSFCGGFIAGLLRTQDFLRATLYGNSLQSLAMEGSGAFYVGETLPGLAESRLNSLASAVQAI